MEDARFDGKSRSGDPFYSAGCSGGGVNLDERLVGGYEVCPGCEFRKYCLDSLRDRDPRSTFYLANF